MYKGQAMSRRAFSAVVALLLVATSTACGGDPQAAAQARMKRLRAKDVFTDARDVKLAEAVALGDRGAIDAAINAGANVNARGDKGMPMLIWAMGKDSVAGFEALLEHSADLKALAYDPGLSRNGERTEQVIERVVESPKSEFLRIALNIGFDPDYVPNPRMNESLLFRAVWSHAIPNARILLEAGADINRLDINERPPIDLAMGIGHYEMVFFLLSSGADPCIKTNGYDLAGMMKEFGTRGVTEKEYPHFLRVVAELKKRHLITDDDIKQADNKKPFLDPQP
jgi:hypothetical protein